SSCAYRSFSATTSASVGRIVHALHGAVDAVVANVLDSRTARDATSVSALTGLLAVYVRVMIAHRAASAGTEEGIREVRRRCWRVSTKILNECVLAYIPGKGTARARACCPARRARHSSASSHCDRHRHRQDRHAQRVQRVRHLLPRQLRQRPSTPGTSYYYLKTSAGWVLRGGLLPVIRVCVCVCVCVCVRVISCASKHWAHCWQTWRFAR